MTTSATAAQLSEAQREVAAIVAWLRDEGWHLDTWDTIADAIETGSYKDAQSHDRG